MCTLLTQCASQTASDWLLALSRLPTQPRAHGQSRGTMHLLRTAPVPLSLGPSGKRGGLVSPMWDQCGVAPSTALNCASPLTGGRQVGQHRSHIVAAVSSACLIARAAASGSQGRIVSSLSPGRLRADVGLSAVWSDLSAVSTTDQVRVFLWLEGLSVCTPRDLSKSAL